MWFLDNRLSRAMDCVGEAAGPLIDQREKLYEDHPLAEFPDEPLLKNIQKAHKILEALYCAEVSKSERDARLHEALLCLEAARGHLKAQRGEPDKSKAADKEHAEWQVPDDDEEEEEEVPRG